MNEPSTRPSRNYGLLSIALFSKINQALDVHYQVQMTTENVCPARGGFISLEFVSYFGSLTSTTAQSLHARKRRRSPVLSIQPQSLLLP